MNDYRGGDANKCKEGLSAIKFDITKNQLLNELHGKIMNNEFENVALIDIENKRMFFYVYKNSYVKELSFSEENKIPYEETCILTADNLILDNDKEIFLNNVKLEHLQKKILQKSLKKIF